MFRVACLLALVSVVTMEMTLQAKLNDHWQSFKTKHLKSYKAGEEVQRQENFKKNVEEILSHNLKADLGEHDHRLAINEFSDMTLEEFQKTMLGYKPSDLPRNETKLQSSQQLSIPASVDWRQAGAVTGIKNQGTCGSCYTFAAAGTVESAWARSTGQLVTLSEQNLLDCSSREYGYAVNDGCNGGLPNSVYQYILNNGGVSAASCYPYENRQGNCRYNPNCAAARISGYGNVRRADERDMADKIANYGPVAVGLDASLRDFMSYRSGVYQNQNCNKYQGNHAVQVIGYGTQNGLDYWLIKNSWGTTWGEQGYMKLARNAGNVCGIANDASFPYI